MDYLFPDKNTPATLSRHLRQLIETIGQTKTKQQEQKIIQAQIQTVKEQLQHEVNPSDHPDILVKLIYFETLGYDTSFARIFPINLCQSHSAYLKKMSYLLAAMLVKPGQKLAILMHNTIIKDLQSENVFTQLTVLTMLRYFINDDIAGEIVPAVRKLTRNRLSMIRRKSIFVLFQVYRMLPHLVDDIREIIIAGLNDSDVPVVFAAVTMMKNLIVDDPLPYKSQTGKLVQIFDKILDHKYPPQYDYHKIPAPWMQIDILKMLQQLGRNDAHTSKLMYDSLDKCMRRSQNIYMHFNKGILQQCIKTIANIYPHTYLLGQAEQALGGFFSEGNHNMRSFGLAAMTHLAKGRNSVLEKWHLCLIDCLESDDITLAERTIGLLVEIANEDNTEVILNRIIVLTDKSTDPAEKQKLIKNSIYLIERFSNDKQIFLRRMNEILYKFEQFISETSINNYLKTLLQMVDLQPQFIDILTRTYLQILHNFRNSTLVKVSVWIVGEMTHRIYIRDKNSQFVDEAVDAILACADEYINQSSLVSVFVVSLMKLSPIEMTSRHEEIKKFLLRLQSHLEYSIHKWGQQFIRIARYGKALYNSNGLQFESKMHFLAEYINKNYEPATKKYLVTKKKSQRSQYNEVDLLSNDTSKVQSQNEQIFRQHRNIFEFRPGHRWVSNSSSSGNPTGTLDETAQPIRKQSYGDSKMVLRGPHQQKKAKPNIDEKKMKLAKSIFGKK